CALTLKGAPGIDKNPFPEGDVFPEVRVQRWEDRDRFVDGLTGQLRQQLPHLRRFVITTIKLAGDAQGILAYSVHHLMQR
ncbi:hypothetical protein, partial [Arthrobacter sp. H14]|uniref:hypothetical protein n=1 Tax=Arthrobacter sp. H14 TaxID=1312959 RepID=UPI00055D56F0